MSNDAARLNFDASVAESRVDAEVLASALRDWPVEWPGPILAAPVDAALRRTLDQVACRFMKLQDTVGERVLPGVLSLTEEPMRPDSTFAEKLQRLERLGAISSVATWRLLREVRNALVDDYPDNAALQTAAYTRLRRAAAELLDLWQGLSRYAAQRLSPPG